MIKVLKSILRAILIVIGYYVVRFLLVILVMMIVWGDHTVPLKKVEPYVIKNHEILESFPYEDYQQLSSSVSEKQFIRNYLGRGTIVKDVSKRESGIIEFYCGGAGNVTSSRYTGFFYCDDNEPHSICFPKEAVFKQANENEYTWSNKSGNEITTVIRIMDHWFYYDEIWD